MYTLYKEKFRLFPFESLITTRTSFAFEIAFIHMYSRIYRYLSYQLLSITQALDALSKKDIAEIRSFTRPPPKVEMVMEAVMILKTSEPSWTESKRQLADVNFLNTVRKSTQTNDPLPTLSIPNKISWNILRLHINF